jgi:hypothetical protein
MVANTPTATDIQATEEPEFETILFCVYDPAKQLSEQEKSSLANSKIHARAWQA